jgi:DNA-binding MarR family transcriptional regulator
MSTLRRRAEAAPDTDPAGDPADLAPLSDRVGFWLRLAQQTAFDAFHRAMAPLGLTPGRLAVLLLLEAERDMRQTALAAALRVKPPNLAVLLAALEHDGLIRRSEDVQNRRVNLLRLTPAGRTLLRRAKAQEALVEDEVCAGMDAAERAALVGALRRIARA